MQNIFKWNRDCEHGLYFNLKFLNIHFILIFEFSLIFISNLYAFFSGSHNLFFKGLWSQLMLN